MSFSTGVIPPTSVSRPQLKSNQTKDRVMLNNSQGKKQEVEDHNRNVKFSKNKTFVTACNDSLNAKTSNVNFVCATCGKCMLNVKHDMCVLQNLNVPISSREPKRIVNQSVATPLRKTVASDSTNQKPRHIIRKLYEHVSKACSWWYPKFTPPGYKWKPKSQIGIVNPNVSMPLENASRTANILKPMTPRRSNVLQLIEIILFIIDSGCSKHMTGNLKLLTNFMEKFLGLNHNLFSIGQFCDADLEVAFRKSTCSIRDLKGNDLLTGSRGTDLYSITLQDTSSPNPICLMAKATSSQAWLWHRHLSHLNFDTINLLSKNDIVIGLPKLKFVKDHLCSSCELGKGKRQCFQTKTTPSSKIRLQLLHMDLCGPMRVESINGKKYVLVIVDDYSRYTWTYFLRSKDETPEVLINFLRLVQRGLHAQVRIVRTDKGTKFLNKTLHAYFASEGINHQILSPGPQSQENVPHAAGTVTMLNELDLLFSPMFDELLNGSTQVVSKSSAETTADAPNECQQQHTIPLNTQTTPDPTCQVPTQDQLDAKNLDKMKEKGDECIFVGYSTQSRAYRVFNKRTRVIMESIHVNFDELPQRMASVQNSTDPAPTCQTMASVQISSDPAPNCQTMALEHNSLSPGRNCQENDSHGDKTVHDSCKNLLLQHHMYHLRETTGICCLNRCLMYYSPPPSVDPQAPEVIAPVADVIPSVQAESIGSPFSTTIDQHAPSPSKSQTTPETQSSIIPQNVEEDIHDIEVAHMGNDPLFGVPIPEVTSAQSSSTVSPHTIMQPDHQIS
nr:retrovirus-related Pol polyprotein from transposon TNT 1-94 [Tanacetum cinerariifolium]